MKYNVITNDETVATRSNKQAAIKLATEARETDKVAVRVETDKGTVVFEAAAPKKIRMSPRYTRVVPLPEGVTAPEGKRVAYVRPRRDAAVLHDAESGEYSLLKLSTSKELKGRFETSRAAGKALLAL
jgi:hypothetical protein